MGKWKDSLSRQYKTVLIKAILKFGLRFLVFYKLKTYLCLWHSAVTADSAGSRF